MDQHPGPLHVPQEVMAQSGPFRRPLDQPRDVRQHKAVVIPLHHPQIGGQGGKMVIGDLGPGAGEYG